MRRRGPGAGALTPSSSLPVRHEKKVKEYLWNHLDHLVFTGSGPTNRSRPPIRKGASRSAMGTGRPCSKACSRVRRRPRSRTSCAAWWVWRVDGELAGCPLARDS
jgi:hypothetical protein